MHSLTLPCPAKLNLGLRVLQRRADGYHELQTLFQLLDYGDELRLDAAPAGELTLNDLPGLPAENNLVLRAARALLAAAGTTDRGARLTLTKRLPAGGGVGGGSSDAATALVGLNALWRIGFDTAQLAHIGAQLGADVAVFVRGRSAFAEGIGERLTPMELPARWYVVLAPACHVSTQAVFAHKDLTRHNHAITVRAFLAEGGINDCEPLVVAQYPEVKTALDWLLTHGQARLTGTGACVFAPFEKEAEARKVLAAKPARIHGFVAAGINESPLYGRLRQVLSTGV